MKTHGEIKRIKMVYKEWVEVPEPFRKFVWDALDGKAPLESIILKVLTYGKFEDIKRLYRMYPEETYSVVSRYPDIKRGVRYWIKRWQKNGENAQSGT